MNAWQHAAERAAFSDPSAQSPGAQLRRDVTIFLADNAAGSDIDVGGAAWINKPLYTHADDESGFLFNVALELTSSEKDAWAVAVEPIENAAVGKVAIAGLVPALVNIGNQSHKFCDLVSGSLVSANAGSAQIVHAAGTSGEQWCLIRLNNPYGLTVTSTDYIPKPYLADKIIGGDDVPGVDGWIHAATVFTGGWQKRVLKHTQPGLAEIEVFRLTAVSSSGAITVRPDKILFDEARHFDKVTPGASTQELYMLPAGTNVGDVAVWDGTTYVPTETETITVVEDVEWDSVNHKLTKTKKTVRIIKEAGEASATSDIVIFTEKCLNP